MIVNDEGESISGVELTDFVIEGSPVYSPPTSDENGIICLTIAEHEVPAEYFLEKEEYAPSHVVITKEMRGKKNVIVMKERFGE